jgi:hypothetical protein
MSSRHDRVLQIVPHLPGSFDGVGDYALNLARQLSAEHGIETSFLVAGQTGVTSRGRYNIISGLDPGRTAELARDHEHVILHYVNYGYQARGVPFHLSAFVKRLRPQVRGRWVTTFHELYASGPPWKSAFWLRPFQVRIAHEMMDAATSCVVSNHPIEQAIHRHDPRKRVHLIPVMSNFGEPELDDFGGGSPNRWAICGGTALIARSLRLLEQLCAKIPPEFAPEHVDLVGGREDASVSEVLERLKRTRPDLSFHHYAEVGVDLASEVLRQSVFGFIDYFGAGRVWPGMLLKSTAFAALCAHGVIPVLAHREPPIALAGDSLPGPFYLIPGATNLPRSEELPETRRRVYRWYHAHAASHQAARVYAEALT